MFWPNNAKKKLVQTIECELSFSTGTFFINYDVKDRKLKTLLICSTVGKWEKWKENTLVEITITKWQGVLASITQP